VDTGECIASPLAQQVMSSCPILESLKAPLVDAHVVAEGKPWVCLRLKFLDLSLCFDPLSTATDLQPLVFNRLSKLTRIEVLWLSGDGGRTFGRGLIDLSIEGGLGKLSTLWLLSTVKL
jgi:hypothetical protein